MQIKNNIFCTWNLLKSMLHCQNSACIIQFIMKKLCKFTTAILLILKLICTHFHWNMQHILRLSHKAFQMPVFTLWLILISLIPPVSCCMDWSVSKTFIIKFLSSTIPIFVTVRCQVSSLTLIKSLPSDTVVINDSNHTSSQSIQLKLRNSLIPFGYSLQKSIEILGDACIAQSDSN